MVNYTCDFCSNPAPARFNANDAPIVPAGWTEVKGDPNPRHKCVACTTLHISGVDYDLDSLPLHLPTGGRITA